eukprot:m.226612 g.226612  ORF g.226612 m.226612 type:complete len:183 (+) comp22362_c0_seq1:74-622(+)
MPTILRAALVRVFVALCLPFVCLSGTIPPVGCRKLGALLGQLTAPTPDNLLPGTSFLERKQWAVQACVAKSNSSQGSFELDLDTGWEAAQVVLDSARLGQLQLASQPAAQQRVQVHVQQVEGQTLAINITLQFSFAVTGGPLQQAAAAAAVPLPPRAAPPRPPRHCGRRSTSCFCATCWRIR